MSERFPAVRSTRRTDEELIAMLDEASEWSVNDRRGKVLYHARSLREAFKEAFVDRETSRVVVAVCQQPGDICIVFRPQIDRLTKLIEP